jgi:exodeoxyribonuclease V gamma subunit
VSSIFHYKSNRLTRLAKELARLLRESSASPLTAELVVVPSLAMRRWLSFEIARLNGVCANVDFPFLADFIGLLPLEIATPHLAVAKIPTEEMTWAIHRILPGLVGGEEFRAVSNYLADADPLKAFQLSERIAELFDQYLVYRPEMIRGWETSRVSAAGHEAWQASLWRELTSRTELAAIWKRRQQEKDGKLTTNLPGRIFVFGLTTIPPTYLNILFEVAKTRPVHVFLLDPSSEYHGDDLTPKQRARRKIAESEPTSGNPLLTSLGRLNTQLTEVLIDTDERLGPSLTDAFESFVVPPAKNLLSTLQSDILRALNRGDAVNGRDKAADKIEIASGDRSLVIHSCHSPMREVEVVYDQLLQLFETDPTLRPRDILVMTPEIEKYSPFIRAAFEYPENAGRKIPYSISDRHPRSESTVIDSFLKLLEIASSRCTAEEVFGLISSPVIAQRFGFSEEDLSLIRAWIRDTRICWGIDASHRERIGAPGTDSNTWRFGLNRLLLGYAMRDDNQTIFKKILPYDEIEGDGGEILGRFLSAAEIIFDFVAQCQTAHTLGDWGPLMREAVDHLLESDDEDHIRDLRFLRKTFSRLEAIAEDIDLSHEIELTVLRHHFERLLGAMEQRGGFLTGGVTFCALKPGRSIPARVIFLLGLNDDVFPRRSQPAQFDLMSKWRLGDPSPREDDRYAFLETLCAAEDCLQITYVGRSIVHNQEIPPSVIVSELLDYLDQAFLFPGNARAREYLALEHPLQAFSARYFDSERSDQRLFSYSEANATAAIAAANLRRSSVSPFLINQLPAPDPTQFAIELNQLISFLAAPARFFLKARFGIDLREFDDALPDDEPIELDQLEKYQIRQKLLTHWIDTGKADLEIFRASGVTASGGIGELQLRSLDRDASKFQSTVLQYIGDGKRSEPLAIDLALGEFALSGTIESIYGTNIVYYRCANLNIRDRLRAWVEHLARSASDDRDSFKTILIGKDETMSWQPVATANQLLNHLCQLYWDGLQRPVAFFPASAFEYVKAERDQAANPLNKARAKWNGGYNVEGEKEDPAIQRLFHTADALNEEFVTLARRVFAPLFQHALQPTAQ